MHVIDPSQRAAEVIGEEQFVVVQLGAPAVLQCYAVGWPRPSVTWWRGERLLPFSSERYEQRRDFSLLLRTVALRDLGPYVCQAYNGLGRATSWTLTVQAVGPVYSSDPDDAPYNAFLVNPRQDTSEPQRPPQRPRPPYRPPVQPERIPQPQPEIPRGPEVDPHASVTGENLRTQEAGKMNIELIMRSHSENS